MTKKEYVEYKQSVADFMEREGLSHISSDGGEGYFSWSDCECCQRGLGGNREDCKGVNMETKEVFEYSLCWDCIYYLTYGQLDDETMWRIENEGDCSPN